LKRRERLDGSRGSAKKTPRLPLGLGTRKVAQNNIQLVKSKGGDSKISNDDGEGENKKREGILNAASGKDAN